MEDVSARSWMPETVARPEGGTTDHAARGGLVLKNSLVLRYSRPMAKDDSTSRSPERDDSAELMDLTHWGTLDESIESAQRSARRYDDIVKRVLRERGDIAPIDLFFQSMVVRVRSLHEGSVREIRAENPQAVFTLERSWAESCALLIYVTDNPAYIRTLWDKPLSKKQGGGRKSTQALVAHASERMPGLKRIHGDLSEVAHFGSKAFWSPFIITDEAKGTLEWTSYPRWKDEHQALVACGWVHELAEASRHLLQEFAEAHLLTQSQR